MNEQDQYKRLPPKDELVSAIAGESMSLADKKFYFMVLMRKLAQVLFENHNSGECMDIDQLKSTHPRMKIDLDGSLTYKLYNILGLRALISPKNKPGDKFGKNDNQIRLIFNNAFISGIDFIQASQFNTVPPSRVDILEEIPEPVWSLIYLTPEI